MKHIKNISKKHIVLPIYLVSQLDYFFLNQSDKSKKRIKITEFQHEVETLFQWGHDFAELYLQSRTERATDLETPEVAQAQELAHTYIGIGNHDFFATCVDGRNMPTVMFSKPPHVGGVLRAPAGTVTGFMESTEPGKVLIDEDSFVVQKLSKLLLDRPNQTIFYGLDSHVGCAARALIHATEGGKQQDKGLRADVLNKMMTARGILELRRRLFLQKKEVAAIIPTFFSYDPHAGGVIMGLEMHVDHPIVVHDGFSDKNLDQLAKEKKIVRALDLLELPFIQKALRKVMKPASADFRHHFPKSLLANWKAVHTLYAHGKSEIYLYIFSALKDAYEKSGWIVGQEDYIDACKISTITLRQKAKFLLKNIVTRYSIAGTEHHWPYEHHKEDLGVITDGGYAPFSKLDAFAVFSRDLNALLPNTKLVIDLIRQFRENGNAKDPLTEKYHFTPSQFISAPVLLVNKAILRGGSPTSWNALTKLHISHAFSGISWDDAQTLDWGKQDILELMRKAVLGKHVIIEAETLLLLVDAVYELFDRMRLMMKDKAFRHMLLHGNVVIMNIIVDENRRPRLIVPFVV